MTLVCLFISTILFFEQYSFLLAPGICWGQHPTWFFVRIVCAALGILILLINFRINSLRPMNVPVGYFNWNSIVRPVKSFGDNCCLYCSQFIPRVCMSLVGSSVVSFSQVPYIFFPYMSCTYFVRVILGH